MRRFVLQRDDDETGVSGDGVVADGVVYDEPFTIMWPDGELLERPAGWVRLVWRGPRSSTVSWPDLQTAMAVHGHDGKTRVVWATGDEVDAAEADRVAAAFHAAYERRAPEFGYATRQASAVPWTQVPAGNKSLMTAVAAELIGSGVISVGIAGGS